MITAEKKELIANSFRRSFDRDMSYQRNGLSTEEIEELNKDEAFQLRLAGLLIGEKEKIIEKLRGFMDAEDERIAFNATTEYGKILYPEMFKRLTPPVSLHVSKDIDEKEEKRVAEEYGRLIGKRNVEKPVSSPPK